MNFGKLFFSAEGRIGRQELWLGWLSIIGAVTVAGWVPFLGLLVFLVGIYCHVCVYAKRLHDMGKSGWLQLWTYVPYAVAVIVTIFAIFGAIAAGVAFDEFRNPAAIASMLGGLMMAGMTWLLALGIDLAFLLWLGIARGEPSDNRFGPEPQRGDYRDAMPIV